MTRFALAIAIAVIGSIAVNPAVGAAGALIFFLFADSYPNRLR